MIIPVILSGGVGSRLWPLSRKVSPKQLLPLVTERTLLQDTVQRVRTLKGGCEPIIVCNNEHRFLIAEQLHEIKVKPDRILLEPVGRNTAPAIAIAAMYALQSDQDPILLVLPSDHIILNADEFCLAVDKSRQFAEEGKLVTFGIVPEYPETGYGYIKAGKAMPTEGIYQVECFVEKPDVEKAYAYVQAGNYYWNSGMFMFLASTYLAELKKYRPDIHAACERTFAGSHEDEDFFRLDREGFAEVPAESIDYAVMEHTDNALVTPIFAGWSDIGSWLALADICQSDKDGNVKLGDVITEKVNNCYLRSEGRLLSAIGIKDLIVIETADAVLVAHKDNCQDVKLVVERLEKEGRREV